MSRKKAREIALHLVFELGFRAFEAEEILTDRLDESIMQSVSSDIALYGDELSEKQRAYIIDVVRGVAAHQSELDELIALHAKGWSMKRISRMTMAVLRLALYEMKYVDDVPVGVAINEAVELAKTYETEDTGAFVNGILGTVSRAEKQESE